MDAERGFQIWDVLLVAGGITLYAWLKFDSFRFREEREDRFIRTFGSAAPIMNFPLVVIAIIAFLILIFSITGDK